MATVQRLIERVDQPFSGTQADIETGIIRGVKLCGLTSANGNDYPASTFKRDIAKYDGAVVNFNHSNCEPLVENVAGRIRNPRVDADGTPRGDVHLLKAHPMYGRVMEAAVHDPGLFGFSHVADCKVRPGKSGRNVVEGLNEIVSVDLVARPATTKGIFEARRMPVTLKQLVEWVCRNPASTEKQISKVKTLREDMGPDMPALDSAPSDGADPDEAIASGFKAAIMAVIEKAMSGDLDPKEAVKKVKKLLDSHGDTKDESSDMPSDAPPADMPPSSESKKANLVDVLRECSAEGYTPGPIELVALSSLTSLQDRKAFIVEQRAKVPADRVQSAARQPGGSIGKPVAESVTTPAVPTDAKTFAESIRK